MAQQKNKVEPAHHDAGEVIETAINKTELFFQKNSKIFTYALAVIVVVVGGYFGYKYLYKQPRNAKAQNMIFVAEQQFAIDSFAVALNGDGNNAGFLDVISRYGNTSAGNIAKHYAGVCYLRIGDLDNAMTYLSKYRSVGGVPSNIINAQNIGLQGDIYSQREQYQQAVEKYFKSADAGKNSFTAPYYLKKAGLVYVKMRNGGKAKETFERIRNEYPTSMEARDIDKYIGEAGQI